MQEEALQEEVLQEEAPQEEERQEEDLQVEDNQRRNKPKQHNQYPNKPVHDMNQYVAQRSKNSKEIERMPKSS